MASDAVAIAIEDHLTANWTATLIELENSGGVATNGTPLPPSPRVPYVVVEMSGTLYAQMTVGAAEPVSANRWDEEGFLWLHVLVENGSGARLARQYAKQLADLFRGLTLLAGDLEFMDARLGRGMPGEIDGNWFRLPVEIEWRRMEA
jgi:hypothetical protein